MDTKMIILSVSGATLVHKVVMVIMWWMSFYFIVLTTKEKQDGEFIEVQQCLGFMYIQVLLQVLCQK